MVSKTKRIIKPNKLKTKRKGGYKSPHPFEIRMSKYWKPIWDNLTKDQTKPIHCVMCKSELPLETQYQNYVQSTFNFKFTNTEKLAVRSYKIPSAMRFVRHAFDNPTIQPTCFYFHCPYCSYIHNFKSSVHMYEYEKKTDKEEHSIKGGGDLMDEFMFPTGDEDEDEDEEIEYQDIEDIRRWAQECKNIEGGNWKRAVKVPVYLRARDFNIMLDGRRIYSYLRWSVVPRPYPKQNADPTDVQMQIDIVQIDVFGRDGSLENAEKISARKTSGDFGHGTKFVLELMKIGQSVGRGVFLECAHSEAGQNFGKSLENNLNFESYGAPYDHNWVCNLQNAKLYLETQK